MLGSTTCRVKKVVDLLVLLQENGEHCGYALLPENLPKFYQSDAHLLKYVMHPFAC